MAQAQARPPPERGVAASALSFFAAGAGVMAAPLPLPASRLSGCCRLHPRTCRVAVLGRFRHCRQSGCARAPKSADPGGVTAGLPAAAASPAYRVAGQPGWNVGPGVGQPVGGDQVHVGCGGRKQGFVVVGDGAGAGAWVVCAGVVAGADVTGSGAAAGVGDSVGDGLRDGFGLDAVRVGEDEPEGVAVTAGCALAAGAGWCRLMVAASAAPAAMTTTADTPMAAIACRVRRVS